MQSRCYAGWTKKPLFYKTINSILFLKLSIYNLALSCSLFDNLFLTIFAEKKSSLI